MYLSACPLHAAYACDVRLHVLSFLCVLLAPVLLVESKPMRPSPPSRLAVSPVARFEQMVSTGLQPTTMTYSMIINAYVQVGALMASSSHPLPL